MRKFPLWLISPTWALASVLKPENPERRAAVIRFLNLFYLLLSAGAFISIMLFSGDRIQPLRSGGLSWQVFVQYVIFSRFVEVLYAFYKDAFEKLSGPVSLSGLLWGERVRLALRSYLELIIDFALIYALLPASSWSPQDGLHPAALTDALWYSANVISTSGGGGYVPVSLPLKALSLCEVFCGLLLLVVCFTVYTGLAVEDRLTKKNWES